MRTYITQRIVQSIVVIVLVVVIVFLVVHLIPGDPVIALLGSFETATPERIEAVRRQFGLDKSLPEQFGSWVFGLLQGDLGISFRSEATVNSLIARKLPATIELAVAALIVSLLVAIPGGILAAVFHNSVIDYAISIVVTLLMSVPGFWVSIVLIYFVAVNRDWLPPGGYIPLLEDPAESLKRLILPGGTLGILTAAPIMRYLRSSLLEELGLDYIVTARSKGLRERTVLLGHAVRNALIPTLTIVAFQFGNFMIGGVVIIEFVFQWPGIGGLVLDAVFNRDYLVLQSTVLLVAVFVVILNLVVDILYAYIDPRIKFA